MARRSYDEDAVARMAAEGRKPSYDPQGNVRGFRSKAGAPMADTSSNVPVSGQPRAIEAPSLTPKGVWSDMFRPRLGSPATPGSADPSLDSVNSALREIFGGSPSDSSVGSTPTPSLDVLAQGGKPTHAQTWGVPALTAADTSMPASPWMPSGMSKKPKKEAWTTGVAPTPSSRYVTQGTTPYSDFRKPVADNYRWGDHSV